MAYSDSERIYRRNVFAQSVTADLDASETTFIRAGTLAVTGTFTADVVLYRKTEGDDTTEGEWVEHGRVTEAGSYNFSNNRGCPWRFAVENHQDGTLSAYLEASGSVLPY